MRFPSYNHAIYLLFFISFFLLIYDSNEAGIARKVVTETRRVMTRDGTVKVITRNITSFKENPEDEESDEDSDSENNESDEDSDLEDVEYLTEPSDVEFRDCAGTINGGNVISTSESHYERLAKYYENCTIITGNLELTHVTKQDIDKADAKYTITMNGKNMTRRPFWFLNNVKEISGYLLIFYVYSEKVELPNLKIIRGRHLFDGNGIYISRNGIKYLRMPQLRSVLKGGITVSSMPNAPLCYLYHTIDFDHLLGDTTANITLIGKDEKDGSDVCKPEQYQCHPKCTGFCYGPSIKDCQELYKNDCPIGCHSCFTGPNGTKHCCDSECAAGCTGLGPKRCVSCQNYNQDGECVPECNGLEKYDREQSKIVPREKDERRYFYESYCLKECPDKTLIEGKYCVVACQAGHYRNVEVDRRKCVPCDGPCPKVCAVPKYLDVTTLKTLVNCSEIDGNLELLNHLYEEPGFEPSLLNNLRSVKIVTGYVMVDGGGIPNDKKPTNLKFLENLKVIEGRDLHIRYSLVVQGLANLTELGLRKLEKLSAGKAVFLNNSQLCYGKDLDWKFLNAEGVQFTHNAPQEFCAKYDYICHDTCDPTKGCWGKGPSQCLKCKHFIKDDECVNTCEEAEGLFKVGTNECQRCDRECSTCEGPTAYDCLTCKNFRHKDLDDPKRFQCVEKCPNDTFAYQNDCYQCHDNCYNNGCNGPSGALEKGCKACRFGVFTNGKMECIAGSDVVNACRDWYGFYPDLPSTYGVQIGECKRCRKECKTCVSLNNCTECRDYNIIPLDSDKMIGCALYCGEGNYQLSAKTSKSVGICQQCHPLCDRTKSCTGPTESDCDRCDYAGIDQLTNVKCVDSCPETHPWYYENFCHQQDVATEARNRKIWIVSIILIILVIVALIIGYLFTRCTRYRKKFEQEQQLHPPEIPEYDKNALTRRPNMNRLNVITRSQLTNSHRILGTGAFGTVYAGFYKVKDAKGKDIQIPVAIKEIKLDSSQSWSTETEMIAEATIMASLDHEHLLRLVGICFVGGVKLVTVLRPMGSLRDFLVTNSNCLGARDLILYCYQICSAMEYLTRHKIVHCDLAARNVLMRKNNHVEVTDFGLAKMLEGSNSAAAGSKVPFKWVPPECLIPRGEFSEASDVWAFGVTCWEIITYGATPYKEEYIQKGDEMYRFLQDGHRLKQPSNCGVHLHGTLISCWSETPASRPHFSDLKETFLKYCKVPTEYIQDRHITQRMDSYIGSEEQQRHQIQRLLSLTDSAMGEQIYTDQNGFQFVYNPINPTNLEDGRPMPISKKRNSSSASSRYKADPLRSHQSNTFDTRLTEVDTDEENYLVPNSAEMVKLDPNGCKYTKVNVPAIDDPTTNATTTTEEQQKHHYQNDGVGELTSEYLNVDETTTEEDEVPVPIASFEMDTVKPQQNKRSPSIGSHKESSSSFSNLGNAYINQTESVV